MTKSRINWFLSVALTFPWLGLAPSEALADDMVPLWKFELVGEDQLLEAFDNELEKTYGLLQKKECYWFPKHGGEKDKWRGSVYFCKRTTDNLHALTATFEKLTVPYSIVPLEISIQSLSAPPPDCSTQKCSKNDGGACGLVYDLGNWVCKHRLHSCIPK